MRGKPERRAGRVRDGLAGERRAGRRSLRGCALRQTRTRRAAELVSTPSRYKQLQKLKRCAARRGPPQAARRAVGGADCHMFNITLQRLQNPQRNGAERHTANVITKSYQAGGGVGPVGDLRPDHRDPRQRRQVEHGVLDPVLPPRASATAARASFRPAPQRERRRGKMCGGAGLGSVLRERMLRVIGPRRGRARVPAAGPSCRCPCPHGTWAPAPHAQRGRAALQPWVQQRVKTDPHA